MRETDDPECIAAITGRVLADLNRRQSEMRLTYETKPEKQTRTQSKRQLVLKLNGRPITQTTVATPRAQGRPTKRL